MDANVMVNGKIMKSFIGQRVSALGMVVVQGDKQLCTVRLSDNVDITVHVPIGTLIDTYCTLNTFT